MIDQKLIQQIRNILNKESQIVAAYVLGSYKKGTATKGSDFDLSIVVQNKNKLSDKNIYALISHLNFPRELDLSVVDKSSSPLFLFQIISTGVCIFQKSLQDKILFEAFVLKNYYDTAHLRNIYYSHLKNKFT